MVKDRFERVSRSSDLEEELTALREETEDLRKMAESFHREVSERVPNSGLIVIGADDSRTVYNVA